MLAGQQAAFVLWLAGQESGIFELLENQMKLDNKTRAEYMGRALVPACSDGRGSCYDAERNKASAILRQAARVLLSDSVSGI